MSSEDEDLSDLESATERKWRTWKRFMKQDSEYSGGDTDDDNEVQFGQVVQNQTL